MSTLVAGDSFSQCIQSVHAPLVGCLHDYCNVQMYQAWHRPPMQRTWSQVVNSHTGWRRHTTSPREKTMQQLLLRGNTFKLKMNHHGKDVPTPDDPRTDQHVIHTPALLHLTP